MVLPPTPGALRSFQVHGTSASESGASLPKRLVSDPRKLQADLLPRRSHFLLGTCRGKSRKPNSLHHVADQSFEERCWFFD